MSIIIKSPYEMSKDIAKKAKAKRLSLNLSQQTLSSRSGVSYGTLKKFERTGQISLESLLKIALALDEFEKFECLFTKSTEKLPSSLDELLEENTRKRGRK
jgi:transcriptional regulator with XRE-family HTH domain